MLQSRNKVILGLNPIILITHHGSKTPELRNSSFRDNNHFDNFKCRVNKTFYQTEEYGL